jgi:hypothetical protein
MYMTQRLPWAGSGALAEGNDWGRPPNGVGGHGCSPAMRSFFLGRRREKIGFDKGAINTGE